MRIIIVSVALATLLTTPAIARLHEVPGFSPEHHVEAIHRPTGCVARLDYQRELLIAAYITDPLCLPAGVSEQRIPLYPSDFHVPASHRSIVRGR